MVNSNYSASKYPGEIESKQFVKYWLSHKILEFIQVIVILKDDAI